MRAPVFTQLLHDQRLSDSYLCSWSPGQDLFREGDHSQELHVLVSGGVEVIKGRQKIGEMREPGTLFGEMSWLRDAKRSATVRALGASQSLCLPRSEIEPLLGQYPGLAQEIARQLAARLAQASEVLRGLKEFCDRLPDAVILSDGQGRILAYNAAAAQVYGRSSHEMVGRQVQEVYTEPPQFQEAWRQAQEGAKLRERVLAVSHPQLGRRLVSTSMSALRDPAGGLEAMLSLGRDVTSQERRHRLYSRLLPALLLLMALSGSSPWWGPWLGLWKAPAPRAQVSPALSSRLAADIKQLSSLLADGLEPGQAAADQKKIAAFFAAQGGATPLLQGVYLLDGDKTVLAAQASPTGSQELPTPGGTYANLTFQGPADSSYKIVILYRSGSSRPGCQRALELAYPLRGAQGLGGWLVLPMDLEQLHLQYGLDEQALWQLDLPPAR